MLLGHDVGTLYDRLCRRVVAENHTNLVLHKVVLVYTGLLKSLTCGHEGIFALFGQACTQTTMKQFLQIWSRHDACESTLIAITDTFWFEADA